MSSYCDHCYKKIEEGGVTALGKKFHKKCFVCEHCKLPFEDGKFIVFKDKPYCKLDYDYICSHCSKVIADGVIHFNEKKYHTKCFKCSTCGCALANKDYYTLGEKPFCKADYELEKRIKGREESSSSSSSSSSKATSSQRSAPSSSSSSSPSQTRTSSSSSSSSASSSTASSSTTRCVECKKTIEDKAMVVQDKKWHVDCFKCSTCRKKLTRADKFFDDDQGGVCCENCANANIKCEYCRRAILDEHLTFESLKYHPQCFKCSSCRTLLDASDFYGWQGKPYCKDDYLLVKKK